MIRWKEFYDANIIAGFQIIFRFKNEIQDTNWRTLNRLNYSQVNVKKIPIIGIVVYSYNLMKNNGVLMLPVKTPYIDMKRMVNDKILAAILIVIDVVS